MQLQTKKIINTFDGNGDKVEMEVFGSFQLNGRKYEVAEHVKYNAIWIISDKNEFISLQTMVNSILFNMKEPSYQKLPKILQEVY